MGKGLIITNALLAVIAVAATSIAVRSYTTPAVTPAELAFLLAQKGSCAGGIPAAPLEP
ncbi:MAG: hypothetical protein U1E15_14365 [Hyphomicrobiales bacterium]